jgi:hypothetical protein
VVEIMILNSKSNANNVAILSYCESTKEYFVDVYEETSTCSLFLIGTRRFKSIEDAEVAYGETL